MIRFFSALGLCVTLMLSQSCTLAKFGASGDTPATLSESHQPVAHPSERFDFLLNNIERRIRGVFGEGPATEQGVEPLSNSGVRNDLFEIQNLAQLYASHYPSIDQLRVYSKAFEDRIGAFREAQEKLNFAISRQADPAQIQSMTARVAQERATTLQFLQAQGWELNNPNNKIVQTRGLIAGIQWDSIVDDRRYLYGALCGQLMDIDIRNWNMFDLTAEFGLHNLKKAIRWHRLEIDMLAGDIVSRENDACAHQDVLNAFNQTIEQQSLQSQICTRDTSLAELQNLTDNTNCHLSLCYLQKLDSMYSLLSAVKDEGEGLAAIGRQISQERLREVDTMYQGLKTDNVFRKLSYELKSCLNKVN